MAYEPTEWEAGMKVTASRLNKIEQGIVDAGGVMIVRNTSSTATVTTFDKTWQEIYDAIENGSIVLFLIVNSLDAGYHLIDGAYYDNGNKVYTVHVLNGNLYSINSPEGYPTYSDELL